MGSGVDPDRPTSGYAAQMTAGGAWIEISISAISEKVAWASKGLAFSEHATDVSAWNRRDIRDSFEGRLSEPIHTAADRLVRGVRGLEDSTGALKKWWTLAQDQVIGTKFMILSAVDRGLEQIEAIESTPGLKADEKSQAIKNVIAEVHSENLARVNAAAAAIPPPPLTTFAPTLLPSVGTAPSPTAPAAPQHGIGREAGRNAVKPMGNEHGLTGGTKDSEAKDDKDGKAKKEERGLAGDRDGKTSEQDPAKADKASERGLINGKSEARNEAGLIDGRTSPSVGPTAPLTPGGMPASPLSGAGAGGGSPASGLSSVGSGLGRAPASSGLGSGASGGAGSSTPAPTPATQAAFARAFSGLDPVAPVSNSTASMTSAPGPAAHTGPPPVPVTAATGGPPPAPVQPASVPPASAPAPAASPLPSGPMGGGLPLMAPPPQTASPLASAGSAAPLAAAAAGPALSATAGASTAAVVPVTASERARQLVARSSRQLLGDLAGECRRLAAALTASSKNLPTLQWVVGGCPDDGSGQLMVVASSVGLGFMPAGSRLPRHTAVHVFAESDNVPWGIRRGWMGDPLKAVQGYGLSVGRPITVAAGRAEAMVNAQGIGVELVTPEAIPDSGVQGGRDRLEIVDVETFDKIAGLTMAGLAALLPSAADFEVEPNNDRTLKLWTQADMAAAVDDNHQIKAWQAFCTDQATASAYKVTRADSDLKARQYFSDYAYFVWNLAQLEKAMEVAA